MQTSLINNNWNDAPTTPSPRRQRKVLTKKTDDFTNYTAMPSLVSPSPRRIPKLVKTKKWESMRMPKTSSLVDTDQPSKQTHGRNNSNDNNNDNKSLRRGMQRTESMRLPAQKSSAAHPRNGAVEEIFTPKSPSRRSRLERTTSMRLPTLMQHKPLETTTEEEVLSPPPAPARPGLTRRWESTPCIDPALASPQRRKSIEEEGPITRSPCRSNRRGDMMESAKRWESMTAMSPLKPKRSMSPTPPVADLSVMSPQKPKRSISPTPPVTDTSRPSLQRWNSQSAKLGCPKPQRATRPVPNPLPFVPLTEPELSSSFSSLPTTANTRRAGGMLAARKWESSRPALQRWESQSTGLGCSKPNRRESNDREAPDTPLARPILPRWNSQASSLGARPKLLRTDSQATNLGASNPMLRAGNEQTPSMRPKLHRTESHAASLGGSNRSMGSNRPARPKLQRTDSQAASLGGSSSRLFVSEEQATPTPTRPKLQRTDSQAASLGGSSSRLFVSEEQATPTPTRPKLQRTDSQAASLGGSSSRLFVSEEQATPTPTRPKLLAARQEDSNFMEEDPRRLLLTSCKKQDKAWTSSLSLASPATNRARKLLASRGWESFVEQKCDRRDIIKTISAPTCHREGSEKIQSLREKLKQKRDSLTAALQSSQRSLQASAPSLSAISESHDMDAQRVLMMSKFKAINKRTSDSLNHKRERLAKARSLAAEYYIIFPTNKESEQPEQNDSAEQPKESLHESFCEEDEEDDDDAGKKIVCGGLSEYFSFSKTRLNMSQRALDTTRSSMPDLVSIREDDDSAFLSDDDCDSTLASRSVFSNDSTVHKVEFVKHL